MIVHEPWWTSTARHADIVLPATTTLERNDVGASPRDRFVMAMHQAVPAVGGARNDYDIFAGLAARLGFRDSFTEGRTEAEWLRHLYDVWRQLAAGRGAEVAPFDEFWHAGHVEIPAPTSLTSCSASSVGIRSAARSTRLAARSRSICQRIASYGYDDCPGHPAWLEPIEWLGSEKARDYPLHMISNQPRTRLHAQLDNGSVSQAEQGAGPRAGVAPSRRRAPARHRRR